MTRVKDMHKREPLLVDKWLADGESIATQQFTDTTRDGLRLAKRFVLDDQATRYCAEIIRDAPRIIADAQDFAIPPFHRTYIEFPFRTWFKTVTGRDSDDDSDRRIGYLIVGNTVRCLAESDVGRPMLYPVQYQLWHPFSLSEQIELVQKLHTNRLALDIFYWGESALKFMPGEWVTNHTFDVPEISPTTFGVRLGAFAGESEGEIESRATEEDRKLARETEWDRAGMRALRANHRFEMILHPRNVGKEPELWQMLCQGSCGELRNIIAMLLFLNRTSKIRAEREEPTLHNRMYKRQPIPLLKHRVITLHVDPKPRLLRLVAGEGIRRRLHDVRGHLCHNRIARENHHDHEWIEAEEGHLSEMQWYCECGALRWWRHEHQRGTQKQGVSSAEYKVVR